jgi:Ni/Co efflux regulator RcnB
MNKFNNTMTTVLIAFLWVGTAQAEIYKHVDANGNVTYSNVKIKGAKKLDLEPADTSFGNANNTGEGVSKRQPSARTATPADFPKVDAGTQTQRDGKRKDILRAELESEKKALEAAKKAYDEGKSNPEVYRTAEGKTMRNVAKYDEKMKTLQADVDVHQRNIELLEKEIANIN